MRRSGGAKRSGAMDRLSFGTLLISQLLATTAFMFVVPFMPLYVQQLGVTDTDDVALWTGMILGVTPGISAVCGPLWGRVADRFGNKILVQRSLLSGVFVIALMAYATEPGVSSPLQVLPVPAESRENFRVLGETLERPSTLPRTGAGVAGLTLLGGLLCGGGRAALLARRLLRIG